MDESRGGGDIVVIGFGWVGQANALALTSLGFTVHYYDIVEPTRHYKDRWAKVYEKVKPIRDPLALDGENTSYLVCVGDRVDENGIQDISLIAKACKNLGRPKGTVTLRSTVLPDSLSTLQFDFYMPEFLHELYAVEECMNPFYFVVGDAGTGRKEPQFFRTLEERARKVFRGTPKEAAFIKYLSNIWNSVRIAFVNEYGDIVSNNGVHLQSAQRITEFLFENRSYLRYGRAYGGHCLPKDTHAFLKSFSKTNVALIKGTHESNNAHLRVQKDLPEWFSSWELGDGAINRGRFIDRVLNARIVRALRHQLRFLRPVVEAVFPPRSLESQKRLWNRLAKKNARYFAHSRTVYGENIGEYEFRETGKKDYERLIKNDQVLSRVLKDRESLVALDIGTGIGRELEYMAADFKEVYGIDISEEMIDVARRRLLGTLNVTLAVNDGSHIPFPNQKFDFIFSHQVFPALPKLEFIEAYLSEIKRSLKPGGIAKIELRTGPGAYRWKFFSGVSVEREWVQDLLKRLNLFLLDEKIENERSLWIIVQNKA